MAHSLGAQGVAVFRIEFRNEQGRDLEEPTYLSTLEVAPFQDQRFPYLRLIDPFSTTVFNHYQMSAVLPELERLLTTLDGD
jgi:hypothetical protein